MSLKTIFQDMRSRSRCVVQDASAPPPTDALDQSCWANMPQELLREVLMRIEASETSWPFRKSVVACAGVCRSWRAITKEIVKTPEVSGRLTFPISIKQSSVLGLLTIWWKCFDIFAPGNFKSITALNDDGKFLLAARKCKRPTYTDYIISLHAEDLSKGSSTYVGKLRSNFLGTKFTIFDGQPPHSGAKIMKSRSTRLVNLKQVSPKVPAGNYPVAHISYELNVLGSRMAAFFCRYQPNAQQFM
uniref:Tubby-like F-box protein 3 n=1 Tax=Cucumis melo TaxID=3656 RepID=A0A9I9DNU3_CUCME